MSDQAYPGNDHLPEETRYRVENTFRQALSLYLEGKLEDAVVGCDFILKMDPQFEPARLLLEKSKDPMAAVDLTPLIARYQAKPSVNVEDCLIQAIELFNGREFQRAIETLSQVMAVDPSNGEARDILSRAQEKLEAMPFVNQFIAKARDLLAKGDPEEARRQILKGLALDEGNPELVALQAELLTSAAVQPAVEPAAQSPDGPMEFELPPDLPPVHPVLETAVGPESALPGEFDLPSDLPPVHPVVETAVGPAAEEPPPPAPPAFPFEPAPSEAPPAAPFPTETPEESPFAFAEPPPAPGPDLMPQAPAPAPLPELELGGGPEPYAGGGSPQDEKIRTLLADGDRAMMQNEFQEAIDIWSRIFLIDIRNEAASQKIEEAKRLLAEQDRKTEEMFNLAVALYNQGKKDEARQKFDEVLGMEPHHMAARNYLRQLDEEEGKAKPAPVVSEAPPPDMEEVLPRIPQVAVIREEEKPKRKLWIPVAAVLGVLALLAAGWLFLGSGSGMGKPPVKAAEAIAKAKAFFAEGKIPEALAELARVPPEDPLYGEALKLETAYKAGPRKKPVDSIDGRPADQVAAEWREIAYRAYQAKDYARAQEYYTKVSGIRPLALEDKAFLDDLNRTLEAIAAGRSAFDMGNLDQAIAALQPVYERDRVLQAREILIKAHYNRGIGALREENLSQAEPDFQAILRLDDNDEMAKKNLRLIQRYKDANKDLLFRTYIKYLKPR